MSEIMSQIELCGTLGKIFGKTHYRLINQVGEAGIALAKTIPGFESYMISCKRRGLTFAVFKGKKNLGLDDLCFPVTGDVIRIVPVVIGSKRAGLLQTILGAVIITAAVLAGPGGIGAAFSAGGLTGFAAATGASLALGGIVQMLSPQPTGLASKQSADNRASYAFGGVTNTAAQGYPVPLLYGRRRIGGAIISAGIYVEDQQ
ncbi:tail assembly protein [Enterobacter chengduensis]|uniref:tail assembly protein n=1 Tax=Enterobacter chengduensis TaxID=2494701 RepID=UPI000B4E6D23|nr:tail assembly protein [Enterobacter chengduensis]MDL0064798.1 tail assembly protein [Enterobacter chengduensis]PNL54939.1 tail assembly protein [Enterobacter hormaechei]